MCINIHRNRLSGSETRFVTKISSNIPPNSTEKEIIKTFKTERDSIIQKYLLYEVGKGSKVRDLLKANVNIKQLKEQRKLYIKHKPRVFGYKKVSDSFSLKRVEKCWIGICQNENKILSAAGRTFNSSSPKLTKCLSSSLDNINR